MGVRKKKMTFKDMKKQSQSFKGGGRDLNWLKLKEGKNKILICPCYRDGKFIANPVVHQVWGAGQKLKAKATSPTVKKGEKDKIVEYGKKLKKKYIKSKHKKLKELHRLFYPTFNDHFVNVIDLNDIKKGVQILKLPAAALEVVHDADDLFSSPEEVFDLNDGHALLIKAKGSGRDRRYPTAQFLQKKSVKLVDQGLVKEKEIMKTLYDLDLLQPKLDDKELEKVFRLLKKQAQRVIDRVNDEDDDDDYDEDEDDGDMEEIDDTDDDDDDDDDDEDEVKTKKSKKKGKKKKNKKNKKKGKKNKKGKKKKK